MIQSKEKINGKEVTIRVYKGNSSRTDSDRAMDYHATQAVKAAIKRLKYAVRLWQSMMQKHKRCI